MENDDGELATFLSLHTSATHRELLALIKSFRIRGLPQNENKRPEITGIVQDAASSALEAIKQHKGVPTYLENWLIEQWRTDYQSTEAIENAQLYLRKWQDATVRYVNWEARADQLGRRRQTAVPFSDLEPSSLIKSQGAGAVFTWAGVPCFKSVYDVAIYSMLIYQLCPSVVVELGCGLGGGARMISGFVQAFGFLTEINSVDREITTCNDKLSNINFIRSDCLSFMSILARKRSEEQGPFLVIEDFHEDVDAILHNLGTLLYPGDYVVIEDALTKQDELGRAVRGGQFLIDAMMCDFFGINCTTAINGILIKV